MGLWIGPSGFSASRTCFPHANSGGPAIAIGPGRSQRRAKRCASSRDDVGVMLAGELLRSILEYVASVQATILQDHIHSLVHEQAARVDMAFYDLPEYFDHLHRAQSEAWHRPSALLLSLGGLMQQGITLLAMCIILLRYGWSVPLVLGLTTIPSLWVLLRYTYPQHQFRTQTTSDERHSHYYSYLLTGRECASELRLFDLEGEFGKGSLGTPLIFWGGWLRTGLEIFILGFY